MRDKSTKEQQRETIKQMIQKSKQSVENYRNTKIGSSKAEIKAKTEQEKQMIYKFEREAQELERMEEQLIKRLQDI